MNLRRKEINGGYPSAVPYWRAVIRSIRFWRLAVWLSLGTLRRPDNGSALAGASSWLVLGLNRSG